MRTADRSVFNKRRSLVLDENVLIYELQDPVTHMMMPYYVQQYKYCLLHVQIYVQQLQP